MKSKRQIGLPIATAALVVLGLLVTAATYSGQSAAARHASTAKNGGTARVAQLFAPDYIFPFFPPADATNANEAFQSLFFRPLYYSPTNSGKMSLNTEVSAAKPPRYTNNGKSLVITLKDWKWSNGEDLTARDVAFFLNMMKAEKDNYGLYIPGEIPDDIASYRVDGKRTLTINFNRVYSHDFLLLDQLSEVVPMPAAWDLTAKGHHSNCASNVHDCAAVYKYLLTQSTRPTSFASNPLWKVVDGPWRLGSLSSNGSFKILRNKKYSGWPKPKLSAVSYETFTSETSEYNVLRSGSSLDVGFLPLTDAPQKPANKTVGRNPVSGYQIVSSAYWGAIGLPLNFDNPTVGAIFRQTYVRQAMQRTVDQRGYIKAFLDGYGSVQPGPVPSKPGNSYQAPIDKRGGPLPFNIAKAKSLLEAHGWKIVPNGADVCTRPGSGASQCGAGVSKGATLSFNASYVDSPAWIGQSMEQWKSDASKVGISLSLSSAPFATVYGATTTCTASQSTCSWQISNFDGIGNYAYPVGALYFSTLGALNYGSYHNAKANSLILKTIYDSSAKAMQNYDSYLADQVPMVWFPMPVDGLSEIKDSLHGVKTTGIDNPVGLAQPEFWYFSK